MKHTLKVGQEIVSAGYIGSVTEICTGQLEGMVVIRLPGGTCCRAGSSVQWETERFARFCVWVADNPNAKVTIRSTYQGEESFSKLLAQVAESKIICGQISFEHLKWALKNVDPEAYASTVRGMMLLADCTEQQARAYVDRMIAKRGNA